VSFNSFCARLCASLFRPVSYLFFALALLFVVLLVRIVETLRLSQPDVAAPSAETPRAPRTATRADEPFLLRDDQILKWLPPTDRPERLAAYMSAYPQNRGTVEADHIMSLILPQNARTLEKPSALVGVGSEFDPKGFPLPFLLHLITGIPPQQIECDRESSRTVVPGDLIFRKGTAAKELIVPLKDILLRECSAEVMMTVEEETRDAVVARGHYRLSNLPGRDRWIEIYGRTLVGNEKGSFSGGSFETMLSSVGQYIEPKRLIVSEADDIPASIVAWHLNDPLDGKVIDDDHSEQNVLRNVSKQTNLTFSSERRKVSILRVVQQK
jgi:hypothetical protein